MKAVKAVSATIIVIIVGIWVLISGLTVDVPVGQVGVRTQVYGIFGSKGLVPRDFGPGWHRDLGPIDEWQLFDGTVQTLEMTRNPERGSVQGRDDIRVTSADGSTISVDATVKYRIMPGQAHKVLVNTGKGDAYKRVVRNEVENACIDLLGAMRTEDFYNPAPRRKKQAEVKARLAASLADNFVEVLDILIRDVQFEPAYEEKIRRKKLADQEVELNKSLARAEEMRGKTQVIEAETKKLTQIIVEEKDAKLKRMEADTGLEITKLRAAFNLYAEQKKADADLIVAQREAEGQLLVKQSEAEGERLRNAAMRGVGGSTIVALEAARNLNLSEVTISTMDTDLLDLDAMATKLGARAEPK
ncbi:MAG: hypothetical protein JXR37_18555 [Kiritimatiellae bacterium]|nr:hypothetical protein [Kiritimatiellia bacterium]